MLVGMFQDDQVANNLGDTLRTIGRRMACYRQRETLENLIG